MEIIQDIKHPSMYRIKFDDGSISQDVYNYTRAVEFKFLIKQREDKYKQRLQKGETWSFPEMGRDKAYDGRTYVFHGSSYQGSPWSVIMHQTASEASCGAFYEEGTG